MAPSYQVSASLSRYIIYGKALAIFPITAPNTAAARASLYRNVGESVTGKSVALINTTEDRSTTWLLLFSIPKLVITGDVVEFTPEGSQPQTMQPATLQAQ